MGRVGDGVGVGGRGGGGGGGTGGVGDGGFGGFGIVGVLAVFSAHGMEQERVKGIKNADQRYVVGGELINLVREG